VSLAIILLVCSSFIALVMELYKKRVRGDKAKEGEIRTAALALCSAHAYVIYRVVDASAIDDSLYNSPFLVVLYTIALYLLQLPACMAFWKPLIKRMIKRRVHE